MNGDRYIRFVTLHLSGPCAGSKGNSALEELFLILGGSACVALGAAGRGGGGGCGGLQTEKGAFVVTGGGLGVGRDEGEGRCYSGCFKHYSLHAGRQNKAKQENKKALMDGS